MNKLKLTILTLLFSVLLRAQCPITSSTGPTNTTLTYSTSFAGPILGCSITVVGKGTAIFAGSKIIGTFTSVTIPDLTDVSAGVTTIVATDMSSATAGIISTDGITVQICNVSTVLPITLLDFKASVEGNSIIFKWKTASEINSSYFQLEENIFGNWGEICIVNAQGNSKNVVDYTYVYQTELYRDMFFRLKNVDIDGTFSYSNVIKVTPTTVEIKLYPNPFKDELLIQGKFSSFSIYNVEGKEVYKYDSSQIKYNLEGLTTGIYFLKIEGEVIKLIKL